VYSCDRSDGTACRKTEGCEDVGSCAVTTIDMLRRKVQGLEDENVDLKVSSSAQLLFSCCSFD